MRIRAGRGRRIQEQETALLFFFFSFFFLVLPEREMEKQANNSENFTKEQSKCSRGGDQRALNTRGPLFLHSRCCLYC